MADQIRDIIIMVLVTGGLLAIALVVIAVSLVFVNSVSKTIGEKGAKKRKERSGSVNSSTASNCGIPVCNDARANHEHVLKGRTGTIIREIQVREKLASPRQVFERYPDLGRRFNEEQVNLSREKREN